MRGFRRAQLRGSDELFRPTQVEVEEEDSHRPERPDVPVTVPEKVALVPSAPDPGSHSVRLSEEEIGVIAEALQRMKYPKATSRPSVDEFERFEDLRRKLLSFL